MPGRILSLVLMKEMEELLLNGQWLKLPKHTKMAAAKRMSGLLHISYSWLGSSPAGQMEKMSWLFEGEKTLSSESVCIFGMPPPISDGLGIKTTVLRKSS